MRLINFILGSSLLVAGVVMIVYDQNANMFFSIAATVLIIGGGLSLNRAITNRSLLPPKPETQRMIFNARENWPLGGLALGLFVLTLVFELLGSRSYFDYVDLYPQLTTASIVLLAGTACFVLWRYLRLVRYGRTKIQEQHRH